MDDPRGPEERLVVGGSPRRRIDGPDPRRRRVAQRGDRRRVVRQTERRLGVGRDHVHAVPARGPGHRVHEHAYELVGRGDEAAAEHPDEVGEAPLQVAERRPVARVDRGQRRQRLARERLTLAGRDAGPQQRTRGGATGADRDRLQPDVLVEHDHVRPSAGEVGEDLGPDRAVDRAGVIGRGANRGRSLLELNREHPQRVRTGIGSERRTAPARARRRRSRRVSCIAAGRDSAHYNRRGASATTAQITTLLTCMGASA